MISTNTVTIIIESVRPGLKDVPSLLLFDDARHDATRDVRNGQRRDEHDGQSTDDDAFSSGGRSSSSSSSIAMTKKKKKTATQSSPPAFSGCFRVRHPMCVPFCLFRLCRDIKGRREALFFFLYNPKFQYPKLESTCFVDVFCPSDDANDLLSFDKNDSGKTDGTGIRSTLL